MAKRRIVLIGYRGTGKSSIGKALSRMTGQGYLDTDQLIEDVTGKKADVRFTAKREFDVPVSILDILLAQEELGWRPSTALDKGIRMTMDWLQHS